MSYKITSIDRVWKENVFVDVRCDNCEAPLEYAFPKESYPEGVFPKLDAKDALSIGFGGGYGMYFDDMQAQIKRFLLCKDCADKLLEQFPCFQAILKVQ